MPMTTLQTPRAATAGLHNAGPTSERRQHGSITAGMRHAGEDFRARFARAHLDPLRALDPSHLRLGERSLPPERNGPGLRVEAARAAVWRAIQAVGGIASPAGSC